MGVFLSSGLLKYIFLFRKMTQDFLVQYPLNCPKELSSKQTFQNECGSSMELPALCLKYFFSGCTSNLQSFELPHPPWDLYKSSDFIPR